jgi:hypothetical protein
MTNRYDALAGEIIRMMEDDRGPVRSKLADLLEKEVGAWDDDDTEVLITLEPEPKAPSASDVWAAREILMQRITPQQAAAFKDDRVPAFFPPFIMPLPNGGDVGFKAIWSSPMSKVGITASFSNGTEHTFKPRDLTDSDVCEWNDQALRTSSLGPPDEPVLVKRRHAIFDSEFDNEICDND